MSVENEPLQILMHDSHIVAINKPAGLMVHRSRVDVHATEFAVQLLRDQIGQLVYPVHRLDRPTSGVLLFGLNKEVTRELAAQFRDRTVRKTYTAIVRGHSENKKVWNEPLKEKLDPTTDKKANKCKSPQEAITELETLKSWTVPYSAGKYEHSRYSLVRARPLTGRKHQLRRHFNHMSHPIIGDTTYGDRRHNRLFCERFSVRRLLLVASQLSFIHPVRGDNVDLTSENGLEFEGAVEQLNRHAVS